MPFRLRDDIHVDICCINVVEINHFCAHLWIELHNQFSILAQRNNFSRAIGTVLLQAGPFSDLLYSFYLNLKVSCCTCTLARSGIKEHEVDSMIPLKLVHLVTADSDIKRIVNGIVREPDIVSLLTLPVHLVEVQSLGRIIAPVART